MMFWKKCEKENVKLKGRENFDVDNLNVGKAKAYVVQGSSLW